MQDTYLHFVINLQKKLFGKFEQTVSGKTILQKRYENALERSWLK